MLKTQLVNSDAELEMLERPWNELSGTEPLRSWDWLATWWKHYRDLGDRELYVLTLYEGDRLIGIAPWYVDRTLAQGSKVCMLGSGHVCTDHNSLVCRPDDNERVATALAEHVASRTDWDRVKLSAIDTDDHAMGRLVDEFEYRGCLVSRHRAENCWVLDLPANWNDYLQIVSQSHRRQLKKWQKDYLDSGRAKLHVATNTDELEEAWNVLVELHQRRRNSLGEPGCFSSKEFYDFHREVSERLLAKKRLRLSWVELDGIPFSAEYHLAGTDTVYTYQCGIDVDRLHDAPGRLSFLLTVRRAIEDGYRHVDFMRGDEPYKAHWRAKMRPQVDYSVFPNRPLARLRGQFESAGNSLKLWVKQGMVSVTG